jgi:hypothetical protein
VTPARDRRVRVDRWNRENIGLRNDTARTADPLRLTTAS